jgi:type IV pilus assembly protein PilQ
MSLSKLMPRLIAAFAAVAIVLIACSASSQVFPEPPTAKNPAPAQKELFTAKPTPKAGASTQPAATDAYSDSGDGPGVKMTRPGTFEIHVQGADLRGVLQLLSTQGRKNIIATKEVTGSVSADLYGVTFREALDAVLRGSGFVYQEKGNFIYVYTPKQLDDIIKAERKMGVKSFKLTYLTAKDAQTLIAPALSSEAKVSVTPASVMGIAENKTDAGGNNYATQDVIIVQDYEDNLVNVDRMLKELDVKPEQVLIEATILSAQLTENTDLGVDLNVYSGIDLEHIGASSIDTTQLILPASPGEIAGDAIDGSKGGVVTDFRSLVPKGGISVGFISNNISAFIRALETVTDVTVMANPKLLIVNKQAGSVLVGNSQGYLTTTTTETVSTQTVEFLDTGTKLNVRPWVGKDGYIRLEIHPELSDGSTQTVGNNVIPSKKSTEVTSNVLVRDGHTIVVGGLFQESTTNGRSQVPLIGNIPVIGTAFRETSDKIDRREIIVLITPHIIKQDAAEAVGEQMRDEAERMRIGQRKGLSWYCRDRLAQTYMRWAKQNITAGDTDRALWDLDAALAIEPRLEEAYRLKERITCRALWADEANVSAVDHIVQRSIMQGMNLPVERIVPPDKPREAKYVATPVREAFGMEERPEDPLPRAIGTSKRTVNVQTAPPMDCKKNQSCTSKPAGK